VCLCRESTEGVNRGVLDVQGGLELTPLVEYSMPYISPVNRGRLLQAESRNRSEIQGLLDLPGIPKDTRTPLERCRDLMKKRLSRSRSEALDKDVPKEGASVVQSPHVPPDGPLMEVSFEGLAPTTLSSESLEAISVDDGRNSVTASDRPLTVNSSVEGALNILAPGPSEALLASLPQTSSATPLELSDESDSSLLDITYFLPDIPCVANGHLLRPLSTSERAAAHTIALNPWSYGLDNCVQGTCLTDPGLTRPLSPTW
jgi:hypothetical protein